MPSGGVAEGRAGEPEAVGRGEPEAVGRGEQSDRGYRCAEEASSLGGLGARSRRERRTRLAAGPRAGAGRPPGVHLRALGSLRRRPSAGLPVAGRPIRRLREAGLLAVAGSLGLHPALGTARVLRAEVLGVRRAAAPQLLIPRLVVQRLVVARLAGCNGVGLVVAKLAVVYALEPRIGPARTGTRLIIEARVVVPLVRIGWASGLREAARATGAPGIRDWLGARGGKGLLGAGHRPDLPAAGWRREALRRVAGARVPGPGRIADLGDLIPGDAGLGWPVAGSPGSPRCVVSGTTVRGAVESRAAVRSPRAFVGRVRVTRISVAVVVDGRLGVGGTGAVGGLDHFPGLGVQLPETVRPGDLGSERRLPPSARAVVRVAP